jgi:hypothetical protein
MEDARVHDYKKTTENLGCYYLLLLPVDDTSDYNASHVLSAAAALYRPHIYLSIYR